jgi:uncharacterized membrane protein HdeD (DUF308 family)
MMYATMSRNWWLVALRGAIALIFGIVVLIFPSITLRALLILFGIFAIVDGLIIAVNAFGFGRQIGREGLFLLGGLFGILIGIVTFVAPNLTLLFLIYLIAARALIVGVTEIITAIELRKEIDFEWFLILLGAISVLFGIVLFFSPAAGILYIVLLLSIYSVFAGVTLLARAWDLRSHGIKTN